MKEQASQVENHFILVTTLLWRKGPAFLGKTMAKNNSALILNSMEKYQRKSMCYCSETLQESRVKNETIVKWNFHNIIPNTSSIINICECLHIGGKKLSLQISLP